MLALSKRIKKLSDAFPPDWTPPRDVADHVRQLSCTEAQSNVCSQAGRQKKKVTGGKGNSKVRSGEHGTTHRMQTHAW